MKHEPAFDFLARPPRHLKPRKPGLTVPSDKAKLRMVAEFSMDDTQPEWALAYRFDIVLRGSTQTVFEEPHA